MMRRYSLLLVVLALASSAGLTHAAKAPAPWRPNTAAAAKPAPTPTVDTPIDEDPDLPGALGGFPDKQAYLQARSDFFMRRFDDASYDRIIAGQLAGIDQLRRQLRQQGPFISASAWAAIGPAPIPNGQTTTTSTAISGRVTAIVVHPTNPDLVYVGLAQGGVWRSADGGLNWTPLFDQQATLAIGSLALAPSNPEILYVGSGEANLSADSYFGLGLYRIENASTTADVYGPFNPIPTTDVIGARTFTGRSISKILVDAADPATVFCATASGIGGINGEAFASGPPTTALRGVYRSTDATSPSPSFQKLTVTAAASIAPDVSGNAIVNDIVYAPGDATGNTIVAWVYGSTTVGNGGIYRTTNAKAATPTFTQVFTTTTASVRGAFATTAAGGANRIIVGTGEAATGTSCTTANGVLRVSRDGGATWSGKLAGGGGYCGAQCFYDLPVATSPTDTSLILIGGAGNSTCSRVYARSTNAGASFTGSGGADVGLHADAHAIVFAPSNPSIVYQGNDGGIWRSADGGATWSSRNTNLCAAQYMGIALHPTDANFTIGGTQDNGTHWYKPDGTWIRADFGDGGFAVIDQNAANTSAVSMYHTYYNSRNALVGYARVTSTASATDNGWTFLGNGSNGIALAENPNFYAPLVRGPGNPNTIYYGTDRLHRSADGGATNPVVSQAPIAVSGTLGSPISAIGIAPSNDNVRLVGLNNFQLWGTATGSSVLTNMTQAGMPSHTIGALRFDPNNPDVAYVGYGGFGIAAGQHVWKTSNFTTGTPTWTAAGNGLPDVPVNCITIDNVSSSRLWAGTDIGVYQSNDGGANWTPYTTGMPVSAVFGMELHPVHRILRVSTHGRGMFERLVDVPVATQVSLVGTEIVDGHPRLTWFSADGANELMRVYRRAVPGPWESMGDVSADGSGMIVVEDVNTIPGRSYEYRLGLFGPHGEQLKGQTWVDVPEAAVFALRREAGSDQVLRFGVTLPRTGDASLELLDVAGRRLEALDLSALAAGDHQLQFRVAQRKPGMYWARLRQGDHMLSTKVVLVR